MVEGSWLRFVLQSQNLDTLLSWSQSRTPPYANVFLNLELKLKLKWVIQEEIDLNPTRTSSQNNWESINVNQSEMLYWDLERVVQWKNVYKPQRNYVMLWIKVSLNSTTSIKRDWYYTESNFLKLLLVKVPIQGIESWSVFNGELFKCCVFILASHLEW